MSSDVCPVMKAVDRFFSVKGCARCGGDHEPTRFKPFVRKPPEFTHWGVCPVMNEPILMEIREVVTPS